MDDNDRAADVEVFRDLRRRPTPELDSTSLWQDVRSRLGPPARSTPQLEVRVRLRWAVATAAVVVVAMIAWVGWRGRADQTDGAADLVLINPPVDSGAPSAPLVAEVLELDLRLVHGYDGDVAQHPPGDRPAGAGGADPLADIDEILGAAAPDREFVLAGAWRGEVTASERRQDVRLSTGHRISFVTQEPVGRGGMRLTDVRLEGDSGPLLADELVLEPGRTYLFGVRPAAPGDPGSLILAVRLLPGGGGDPAGPGR